jgi:hypothetical protein
MTDPAAALAVFVYFKANASDDAAVLSGLARHRQLLSLHGVHLRFWRRTGERPSNHTTWMESYENTPHPLQVLTQLISDSAAASGLTLLAQGPRHVEIFEPIEPVEPGSCV